MTTLKEKKERLAKAQIEIRELIIKNEPEISDSKYRSLYKSELLKWLRNHEDQ